MTSGHGTSGLRDSPMSRNLASRSPVVLCPICKLNMLIYLCEITNLKNYNVLHVWQLDLCSFRILEFWKFAFLFVSVEHPIDDVHKIVDFRLCHFIVWDDAGVL